MAAHLPARRAMGGHLRVLHYAASSPVFGYGFAVAALLPTIYYETAAVKQLGGTVSQFIVLALVLRFVLPHLFAGWWTCVRRAPRIGRPASGPGHDRGVGLRRLDPAGVGVLRGELCLGHGDQGSRPDGRPARRGHDVRCVASGWNDGDFLQRLDAYGIPHETVLLGKLTKTLRPISLWWMMNTVVRLPGALWRCRRHLRHSIPRSCCCSTGTPPFCSLRC